MRQEELTGVLARWLSSVRVASRPRSATRSSNYGFGLRHPLLHQQLLSTQRRGHVVEHGGRWVRKSPGEILG